MKRAFQSLRYLSIAVALIALTIPAATQAGDYSSRYRGYSSGETANLMVWRAADFGYWISLGLYIDGQQVTSLGWNQGYQATVRPGEHTLSVITSPSPYGKTRVSSHKVHMRPGETYKFTALWREAQLPVLEAGHVRTGSTGW
jgi:hypothetical protein